MEGEEEEEDSSSLAKRRNRPPSKERISTTPRRRTPFTSGNGHHRLPSSSPPPSSSLYDAEFEVVSLKTPSYTSLKDLIPSILCPPAAAVDSVSVTGYEVSIRNRLVKQAAWAYLQPMSTSPSSSERRLWGFFSGEGFKDVVASVGRWVVNSVARVCVWLEDALWFVLCR